MKTRVWKSTVRKIHYFAIIFLHLANTRQMAVQQCFCAPSGMRGNCSCPSVSFPPSNKSLPPAPYFQSCLLLSFPLSGISSPSLFPPFLCNIILISVSVFQHCHSDLRDLITLIDSRVKQSYNFICHELGLFVAPSITDVLCPLALFDIIIFEILIFSILGTIIFAFLNLLILPVATLKF